MSFPALIRICKVAAEDIAPTRTSVMKRRNRYSLSSCGFGVLCVRIDAEIKWPE